MHTHQKSFRAGSQFGIEDLQNRLRAKRVFVIANGQIGSDLKLFAYAQMDGQQQYFLMELLANPQTSNLNASIKSTRFDLAPSFGNLLDQSFADLM